MNQQSLSITAYREGHECYIKLAGSLTLPRCEDLSADVARVVSKDDKTVIIGLQLLEFVDSAGLGMLIQINSKMKRDKRDLVFIEPGAQVFGLMKLAKIDLVIPIQTGEAGLEVVQRLEQVASQVFPEREVGPAAEGKAEAA